jgi:hypothetical protein
VLVCASLVTVVAARVRKGLCSNGDELPLIAALAKDELDYSEVSLFRTSLLAAVIPNPSSPLPPVLTTNCLMPRAASSSTVNLWVYYYGQEIVLLPRFVDSQSLNLRLVQTFGTVSLGNRVNKGAGLLGD